MQYLYRKGIIGSFRVIQSASPLEYPIVKYHSIRYEYVYCDIAARRLDWDNQKCNKI